MALYVNAYHLFPEMHSQPSYLALKLVGLAGIDMRAGARRTRSTGRARPWLLHTVDIAAAGVAILAQVGLFASARQALAGLVRLVCVCLTCN